MKKRIISITALMAMLFGFVMVPEAKAQLFFDDDDMQTNDRSGAKPGETELPNIPELGSTLDQYEYAPLGGEVLVLGLLGGAYLLGKKKKDK